MVAMRTIDVKNDFKRISEIINSGQKVIIARPQNQNIVMISEEYFNELERTKANNEYYAKLDEATERIAQGRVVVKTIEELEEMAK